jgi:hypothetical protein
VFEELDAIGIHAEPAVYDEAFEYEVREQLLAVNGSSGMPIFSMVRALPSAKTRTFSAKSTSVRSSRFRIKRLRRLRVSSRHD